MKYPLVQLKHRVEIVDEKIVNDNYEFRIGESDIFSGKILYGVTHNELVQIKNEIDKQLSKSCQILKV